MRLRLVALALGFVACTEEKVSPLVEEKPPPVVDENGRVPDLSCPGTAGCESSAGELTVGVAARAITPEIETWTDLDGDGRQNGNEPFDDVNGNGVWDGVWMAGFGMGRGAQGVHDDVWSRVVVIRKGDVSVGLVVLDLVGLFHDDVIRIRLAAQAAGLDLDHIAVSTTHTHEGPDTMGIWGENPATSGYDDDYVSEVVISRTVEALADASAAARPVVARVAVTQAPSLVNDTRLPEVVDQALSILQFRDPASGAPVATTVFWGNHPEALGSDNVLLSSDYAHYVRDELETRYPQTTAVFFNGSLGGLSTPIGIIGCPGPTGDETCPQGTWERAEYVGRGAGAAAADALDAAGAIDLGPEALDLAVERRSFLLTTTNGALALAFFFGLLPRNLFWSDTGVKLTEDEVAALVPSALLDLSVSLQSEVNLIRIGPVAIASVPGELYPELWLAAPGAGSYIERPPGADFPDAPPETPLQSLVPSGAIPVIINNGNDALGYILPKSQWDVQPPYAYGETEEPQYGEQNSLGAETGARIAAEFAAMMGVK